MTTIRMDADSALAGAIQAISSGTDLYMTLRDGQGVVRYSGSIQQWTLDWHTATVKLIPIAEQLDHAVEMHAAIKRVELENEARAKGLL